MNLYKVAIKWMNSFCLIYIQSLKTSMCLEGFIVLSSKFYQPQFKSFFKILLLSKGPKFFFHVLLFHFDSIKTSLALKICIWNMITYGEKHFVIFSCSIQMPFNKIWCIILITIGTFLFTISMCINMNSIYHVALIVF